MEFWRRGTGLARLLVTAQLFQGGNPQEGYKFLRRSKHGNDVVWRLLYIEVHVVEVNKPVTGIAKRKKIFDCLIEAFVRSDPRLRELGVPAPKHRKEFVGVLFVPVKVCMVLARYYLLLDQANHHRITLRMDVRYLCNDFRYFVLERTSDR